MRLFSKGLGLTEFHPVLVYKKLNDSGNIGKGDVKYLAIFCVNMHMDIVVGDAMNILNRDVIQSTGLFVKADTKDACFGKVNIPVPDATGTQIKIAVSTIENRKLDLFFDPCILIFLVDFI